MKKKIFTLIASMLLSTACYAQNTTVTATVTDGDSVAWANATWTIDFVPGIQFPNPSQYTVNGSALSGTVTHQTGTLNSSGALSVVVYDNTVVTPTGSGWKLNICPLTSGSCVTYQFSTAGGSQSISSNLTTLIGQPRFNCIQICRGYNTIEAQGMVAGSIFYNTSPNVFPICNQYTGSSWGTCSAGSSYLYCNQPSAVSHTGDTNDTLAFSCAFPSGTIKNNSIITLSAMWLTGGNTNTCTMTIRFGNTNTVSDNAFLQDAAFPTTAKEGWYGTIAETNAANSQTSYIYGIRSTPALFGFNAFGWTVSTTTTAYLSFWYKAGVNTDTCYLYQANVNLTQ